MTTGLILDGRLTVMISLFIFLRLLSRPVVGRRLDDVGTTLTSEHSLSSQRQSVATPDRVPRPTGGISIVSTLAHFRVAVGRRAGGVVPLPPLIPFGTALRSYVLIRL